MVDQWVRKSPAMFTRAAKVVAFPATCVGLVVLAGCYQYALTSFEAVTPGTEIRVTLSSEKVLEMEPLLGRLLPQLEGEMLERRADALLLAVPQLQAGGSVAPSTRLRQRFWFEERDLIRLETKTLNRRRTGILMSVTGALVGYTLYWALGGGAVDTDEPPGSENGGITPFRPIFGGISFR